MTILDIKNISIKFGGLKTVTNFVLKLEKGELVGLIGPNGAGKTTVFNMLTGVYSPAAGDIIFNEENIAGLKPFRITQMGIARTFQNIRLFKDLTVLDNVRIAFHSRVRYNALQSILRTSAFYNEEDEVTKKAEEFLKIFGIHESRNLLAKNLPYGKQRELEITRALATGPKLLLLDEPAAGMNPQETGELMNLIKFIKGKFGLTILLIEHDMNLVMGICERIAVLDHGIIIAAGTPEEIKKDPKVIEAYLGEEVSIA